MNITINYKDPRITECDYCGRPFVDTAAWSNHQKECKSIRQSKLDKEWEEQKSRGLQKWAKQNMFKVHKNCF